MTAPLRLLFAGSPDAAVPSLRALAASPHRIVAVITREDSPVGRRRTLTPTPVATAAEELGLRVIKANRLRDRADELVALCVETPVDLGVVVAYGGLVREPLLSAPRLGWINLHFSLLPRWRGAAPVQHALIAGDAETGTAVFQLVEDLDAGPVFDIERQPIGRLQTAGHLLDQLAVSGARQLERVVDSLARGTAVARPQVGEVTLAPKLDQAAGRIDWTCSADEISQRIRAVTPEPGAFTEYAGERIKLHEVGIAHGAAGVPPGQLSARGGDVLVGTGTDPLVLRRIQPAGKTVMSADAWWRGRRPDAPGSFSS